MFGLVINDGVAGAIIGGSFMACLSLMAWIVQKLASIDTRVSILEDRQGVQNGQQQRRYHVSLPPSG